MTPTITAAKERLKRECAMAELGKYAALGLVVDTADLRALLDRVEELESRNAALERDGELLDGIERIKENGVL